MSGLGYGSLHHHSTYSYLDGFGTPEEHAEHAAEMNTPFLAMTEHGNVSSHVKHEQACKKYGIKPVFGVELYTGAVDEERRSKFKWHLTVLAENQVGYQNLLRLVSEGWKNGFYYEPTVSAEMLDRYREGLVVLSGCASSKIACDLLGGKGIPAHEADLAAASDTAQRFRDLLGDKFYLEVQAFPELERTRHINQAWAQLSRSLGIPLVVTGDVHYPRPDDNQMQVILHAVGRGGQNNTVEKQAQGWGYDIALALFQEDAILDKLVRSGVAPDQARAAVATAALIGERCNVTLPRLEGLKYREDPEESQKLFRAWLRKGWEYRKMDERLGLDDNLRREYIHRVKYEIGLIESKGFVDYFLMLSDVVRFAKNRGIPVGPARGSAAASLVCYLLRITEVDPIPFPNLLFERFIDINRHDLPDIDLDFDDDRRPEIRQYLVDTWGEDRVGNIGTFTKYRGKNSLIDVARVHEVPEFALNQIKELLIERASGDLRGDATIEDTIEMFPKAKEIFEQYPVLHKATRLEGNMRGFSVHAAGLVVSNRPLTDYVATYTREDKKTGQTREVLSIDKYDADYLNVLKIDVLGLTTMGQIRLTLEMINMTLEELYAVPLDDPETMRGFKENDVVGIFQFDGRAMRSVNQELKPDTFAEICDVNALARPGPLHSGAAAEYIQVKHGKKKAERFGPVVDKITLHTNYQIVYQEQILQVVRQLANFSWEEAARIRKLISKKQGEQAFNAQRERFMQGTAENGIPEVQAAKIWKLIVTAGAYAFNAAHCVSYGMLAFWTMWLKRHYPQQFYVAALQKVSGSGNDKKKKEQQILRDAAKKGLSVLPPHVGRGGATWAVDGPHLRAGLTQIPGVGERAAEHLILARRLWSRRSGRPEHEFQADYATEMRAAVLDVEARDFSSRPVEYTKSGRPKQPRVAYNAGTLKAIEKMAESDDPFELEVLRKSIHKVRDELREGIRAGGGVLLPRPTHTSLQVPYDAVFEHVTWLGVIRERNLKDLFELHRSRTGEELDPTKTKDPHLVNWVVMLGEDEEDVLSITVDRWKYAQFKEMVWGLRPGRDLVLVQGLKKKQMRRAIYVKKMWVLEPD